MLQFVQGILTEREESVHLTSLYQLVQISCFQCWKSILFISYKTSFLEEEVNCTEPSPSVRIPWFVHQHIFLKETFASNLNVSPFWQGQTVLHLIQLYHLKLERPSLLFFWRGYCFDLFLWWKHFVRHSLPTGTSWQVWTLDHRNESWVFNHCAT